MALTDFTPEKQAKFLRQLAQRGIISEAARLAATTRQTAYNHRDSDPEFAAAWDEALEIAAGLIEAEIHRRAIKGVLEPVYYKGEEVGTVRKYSDTLLIFLAKAHKPERFKDNASVELTGKGGGKIQVEHSLHDIQELLKLEPRELARVYGEALGEPGEAQR